jgi:hypothetical protein
MSAPTAPSSPPRRSRRRLIWVAAVAAVAIWCGLAALRLVQAERHAQKGLDLLEAVKHDFGPAELIRGKGQGRLEAAQAEFDDAASAGDSLLLKPFMLVPYIGRQVRSVDALTGSAAKVVGVGVEAMSESTERLDRPTTSGPDRVNLIRQLGGVAAHARGQLRDVDLGPDQALVGPLADARRRFGRELGQIRQSMIDLDDASLGIAQMAQGPSRYLLLAANNAEMRAGSGMLLSAGVMTMANGQFDLGPMTDTGLLLLPPGAVAMKEGDFKARWGWADPSQEWRNLAMSPEFPASAELAARMWKARTGEDVDGVFAIDPFGLRSLMEVSGPVVVDGKLITRDNVVRETLLQQYLDGRSDTEEGMQARREQMSDIARAVIDQLDQKGWDVAMLVEDLREAARGRHVLAWSSIPEQQRAWRGAGVAGELGPDSLMVSLQNRAGNKLDQFLNVLASFEHRPVRGGSEVTVRINVANVAPAEGLTVIVEGPYREGEFLAGEYQGILSVNVPGAAGDIRLEGTGEIVASGREGPTRVVAGKVRLLRGEQGQYVVRFRVTEDFEHVTIEPSARSPEITWAADGEVWKDNDARTVRW